MGGGRSRFTPVASGGKRADGRDLTREWAQGPRAAYVADAAALAALRPGRMDHVLGLFDAEHLPDVEDRPSTVPSLADMTTKAIDLLSADRDGYFLMVEGGKIDHLNHANQARGALAETVDFAEAVKAALAKVDLRDTLVIVTADHSHGLTMSGYAARGTPILGLAGGEAGPTKAGDGKAFTTLGYATGPGGPKGDEDRHDPAAVDTTAKGYTQAATVHLAAGPIVART
jgi:alkaline phosphatase